MNGCNTLWDLHQIEYCLYQTDYFDIGLHPYAIIEVW